jgi:signal transduction histidine kinase
MLGREAADARGPASDAPVEARLALSSRNGSAKLALLVAGLGATLLGLTLILLALPRVQFAALSPDLDLVITATSTLVAGMVAGLAWSRFGEHHRVEDQLRAAAFLTLSVAGAATIWATLSGADAALGMRLAAPGQFPIYAWAWTRLIAALTLVAAAAIPNRAQEGGPSPRGAFVLAPAALVVWLAAATLVAGSRMPELLTAQALATLRDNPIVPSELPGVTPLGYALQLSVAISFLVAAWLEARQYERGSGIGHAYLAIGLVFAAFAQLHSAIYPGAYTGLLTSGDLLRLAFYTTLLLGILAEARADRHALRTANHELEALRDAAVAHAALQERARLAREIHDGLAQDLWFAKMEIGRFAERPDLPPEVAVHAAELRELIDDALADARQAFGALDTGLLGRDLREVLREYVAEFAERSGLRAEFVCDDTLPALPLGAQGELLRVVQEALNNTRKHAEATWVQVRAEGSGSALRLVVSDNGHGFDPILGEARGLGLRSMRERARGIGGEMTVASAPSGGTSITIVAPIQGTAA